MGGFFGRFFGRLFDVVGIKTKSLSVNDWRKFSRANDVFNHVRPPDIALANFRVRPSLVIQLNGFYQKGDRFLFGLDIVVLVAAILVTLECAAALKRAKAEVREAPAAD